MLTWLSTWSNWFQLIEPFKTSSTAWRCFKTNSSTWPRLQGRSCSGFYRWESGGVRYLVSDVSVYWIVLARFFVFSWCITSLITWIIHLLIACLIGCLIDKLMDWLAGWVSKRVLQMLSTGNTTQWLNRGDWVPGQGFVVLWWTCLFCQVKVVVYITLYICLKYILYIIPYQTRLDHAIVLHCITLHCITCNK